MITRIVKLTIKPSRYPEFIRTYSEAQKTIRTFEGCVELSVYNDVHHPSVIFTLSKWRSENDLDHYRFSEFFKDMWSKVKPMFDAKAEAWSLEAIRPD